LLSHLLTRCSSPSPIVLTPSPSTTSNPSTGRTFSAPSPGSSDNEADESVELHIEPVEEEVVITAEAKVDSFLNPPAQAGSVPHKSPGPQEEPQHHRNLEPDNGVVSDVISSEESEDEAPESLPIERGNSVMHGGRPGAGAFSLEYGSHDSEEDDDHEADSSGPFHTRSPHHTEIRIGPSQESAKSPSYSPSSPRYSPQSPIFPSCSTGSPRSLSYAVQPPVLINTRSGGDNQVANIAQHEPLQEYLIGDIDHPAATEWFDKEDADIFDGYDDMPESNYRCPSELGSDSTNDSEGSGESELDPGFMTSDDSESLDDHEYVAEELEQVQSVIDDAMQEATEALADTDLPPRDPSPSDAALARTSLSLHANIAGRTLASLRGDEALLSQHPTEETVGLSTVATVQQQYPSSIVAGYSYDASAYTQRSEWPHGFPHDHGTHYQAIANKYTHGPFALSDNTPGTQAEPSRPSHASQRMNSFHAERSDSWPYFGGDQLVDIEMQFNAPVTKSARAPSAIITTTSTVSHGDVEGSDSATDLNDSVSKRRSQLRISHLVNDATEVAGLPVPAVRKTLKRKVATIENENDDNTTTEPSLIHNPHGFMHVTALSDRGVDNAREPPQFKDTTRGVHAQENGQIETEICQASEYHHSSIDSHPQTFVNTTSELSTIPECSEPVQKRARTEETRISPVTVRAGVPSMRRNHSWFWKAATHAFAVTVGAVGTVALLLATATDDTRQEAMAEY
jgi:hypothetical protein